jgi:hypothetical protein
VTGRTALLFWCYRDLPVCRNRVDVLRRENPGVPIFGLYGGAPGDAAKFRSVLEPQLDDFWSFDEPKSSKWKWLHGDLMLAAWYEARGKHLDDWDHVFVAQWDMLVLQPVRSLVPELGPDDVLLSGVLPVRAVEPAWVWSRGGHAPEYRAFLEGIESRYGPVEPLSCVFVVACLPRRLLAAYAELPDPETGYIEYRLPTLAGAIGLRFVEDDRFSAWRPADASAGAPTRRQRFLNGSRRSVLLPSILREQSRADGARVFHPYHGLYPITAKWAVRAPVWAAYSAARAAQQSITARVHRLRDSSRVEAAQNS